MDPTQTLDRLNGRTRLATGHDRPAVVVVVPGATAARFAEIARAVGMKANADEFGGHPPGRLFARRAALDLRDGGTVSVTFAPLAAEAPPHVGRVRLGDLFGPA